MNETSEPSDDGYHCTYCGCQFRILHSDSPVQFCAQCAFPTEGPVEGQGKLLDNQSRSELIGAEDNSKPLIDEIIVQVLKTRGINAARRTVTKIRIQLGIPPSRFRRDLSNEQASHEVLIRGERIDRCLHLQAFKNLLNNH